MNFVGAKGVDPFFFFKFSTSNVLCALSIFLNVHIFLMICVVTFFEQKLSLDVSIAFHLVSLKFLPRGMNSTNINLNYRN